LKSVGENVKLKISGLVIAIVLLSAFAAAAEKATAPSSSRSPRVFSMNTVALQQLRDRVATGKFSHPALDKLRLEADKALNIQPVSVMQKSVTPASGDKHDYLSLARYWWPDPTKPGGLPYIRRDGEVNTEINNVEDEHHLDEMVTATTRLALAYYLYGDEKYAAQATTLLRVWFLNPATRMNPNLQYAQATRGRNTGRGSGLIDSRRLSHVVDTIGLLAGSKSWTSADQKGMQDWFTQYLKWLQVSKNGRDESRAENNHGSFYDVQVASIALFTGDTELATKILKSETKRISAQIDKNGGQPFELERTRSLWYSTFNLTALFQLAQLGESVGVDLWAFETKDGRSMRKALDYLTPYVTGEKKWPYKQIDEYRADAILPVYLTAAARYKSPGYEQVAQKIHPGTSDDIACLLASLSK
jgi:Alginate lyase